MSITIPNSTKRDIDGLAVIGRTLHDLHGIRYENGEGGAAPAAVAAPAVEPAAPAVETPPAAAPAWDGKIESLDPAAQKIISDLRKEAGDNRVKATSADTKLQAILTAAGIGPDTPDPAEVARTASAAAASAVRELAVFKAAALAGADPTKLLDRTSFTASIQGIDPTDGPAIRAAIDAAVTADSTLKAALAASASGIELGGTGETGQITEAQLAQMNPEQISSALKAGKLAHLL